MAVPGINTREPEAPGLTGRIVEAARQAAAWSHDARLAKDIARDALGEQLHAARRTLKSVTRELEDFQDEAIHYVKRQPVKAIGIAAGVGLVGGAAVGWLAGRLGRARPLPPK